MDKNNQKNGSEYGVIHHNSEIPQTLRDVFSIHKVSIDRAEELLWLGAIYINEVRALDFSLDKIILPNTNIRLHLQPRRFFNGSLASRIVSKHANYYVIDKPGGLPTHALVDNIRESLIGLLHEELKEELFVTHRLDIVTSGVIIVARNREAQAKINQLIKERKIMRKYMALVEKPLPLGTLIHFMKESPKAPKVVTPSEQAGTLKCELEIISCGDDTYKFEPIMGLNGQRLHLVEINLVTGRSQQIRAQLAAEGAPIVGDRLYGSKLEMIDSLTQARCIALRATEIAGLT